VSDNAGINVQVGPLRVDVPRTAGYYGGVAAALALGLIDWPVAVFIGAVPAIKLLQRGDLPVKLVPPRSSALGHAAALVVDGPGAWRAGADPRSDGSVEFA
jgi:hypothetical protein